MTPDRSCPGTTPRPPAAITGAVLLAGGRGSRLGGVDKAGLRVGGRTLASWWGSALTERGIRVAVVGPASLRPHLPASVALTREDPPFAGPAAALFAGLRALEAQPIPRPAAQPVPALEYTAVLAVDIVDPPALLDWLIRRVRELDGADALVPIDAEGHDQLTCSAHAAGPLRRRIAGLTADDVAGASLRRMLMPSAPGAAAPRVVRPPLPPRLGLDVDTPDDARRLGVLNR